jgi:hypothetical protein
MNIQVPTFSDLFEQLGLSSDQQSISDFISSHSGLPDHIHIADAPFWTPTQAAFLKGALAEDAEWAELIDQLNASLR